MALISVLMSAYNVEGFVDSAVQSVLRQTMVDFEFLIANDASTDGTWRRLEVLSKQDNRIRMWNRANNYGNVANQNFLFEQSSGKYIAFMDADDISIPTRLEEQMEVLESGRPDICGGWTLEFGLTKERIASFPESHVDIATRLLFNCAIAHPTVMMRRSVFEATKFRPETTPAADYDYWVRALHQGAIMYNLPKVLVGRRLHSTQTSSERHSEQVEARRKASLLALSNLGVFPSPEEHRSHLEFFSPPKHLHSVNPELPASPGDGVATREWLKKLAQAFGNNKYCLRFLAKRWYMYCLRSSSFGLRTYRLFHSYDPSGRGHQIGKLSIVFVLCLFRVRYHSRGFKFLSLLRKDTRLQRAQIRKTKSLINILARNQLSSARATPYSGR